MNRKPLWSFCTLLLLAAFLRFWELGAQSLWYDEAYTWWVGSQVSIGDSLASSIHEIIPPGSYLLWRGWTALTGESEFAMRALSALLGVVGTAAAGRVAWRLTRRRAGATAALLLFAIAPPLLWASREVRMYGPLLAFTLLADMALLETLLGLAGRRRLWAWLWGLTTVLALYTLVLAGFWILGQGLFAWFVLFIPASRTTRARSLWRNVYTRITPFIAPAIVAALLYLPWVWSAARSLEANRGYWPGYLPPAAFFRTTLQGITVFQYLPDAIALAAGTGVLLLAVSALLLSFRRPLAWLYPLCYGAPLLLVSYLYRTIPKWGLRHSVIFAPALYLALALAWGSARRLSRPLWRRIATIALSITTLLACVPLLLADRNLLTNPAFAREDWRSVARYIREQRALAPDEKSAIIIETGSVYPTWAYYAGLDGVLPLPDETLLDVFNVLHYGNTAPALETGLQGVRHVWLVTWLPEVTDPTGIVAALLETAGKELPAPDFHGIGVRHFVLERSPDFPPDPPSVARPDAELLPGLRLWGYDYPETLPADHALDMRTWWTISDPTAHIARFYQASLRLQDALGFTWITLDEPPGGGDYRPERWTAGTPVLGRFEMQLPAGLPSGTYTATLILYDETAKGTIPLGEVRVIRPATPPAIPEDMARVAPAETGAPLTLLAVRARQSTRKPCEILDGQLFWEIRQPLSSLYTVRVALGAEQSEQPLLADSTHNDGQIGDRFISQFQLPLSCRAPDATSPLSVTLLSTDNFSATWRGPAVTVSAGRQFAPPATLSQAEPVAASDLATLLGYRVEPATLTSNAPLTITAYWRVQTITDVTYTSFAHVTPPGALAPVVAQHDAWPAQGTRPTFTWLPGEVIADVHPLPPLPPGAYQVQVGFYFNDTRLPLTLNGAPLPDNVYTLPMTLVVQAEK
ncbi:MAG: hypothetical protein JXA21_09600 [Anaerolineae bacterium]|nr:hypothetical protein [Anaerolineae bacterium]